MGDPMYSTRSPKKVKSGTREARFDVAGRYTVMVHPFISMVPSTLSMLKLRKRGPSELS
ncbi:MAG: hypothetical protein JXA01_06865 [Dehalococcoidia bacterium]|nr:hypothetical protein [Dehalococcoidia bacterium]